MPLPVPDVERELTHTRLVRFEGFRRSDGLWDIEGHLLDTKSHDYALQTGVRRAGGPIHDMRLRLTVDAAYNVLDSIARSDAVPYPGGCEAYGDAYRALVGLNLLKGFRLRAMERLGGVRGCTHLTEMLAGFPTAAVQTFAGEQGEDRDDGGKPFQIDQCHALASGSETVRKHYPKWHRTDDAGIAPRT